jgi:hypothetical protein
MSRYNIKLKRGLVKSTFNDAINGRGPMWAYARACADLTMTLAQRDDDRRNAATAGILRLINFPLAVAVQSAQRAAQSVIGVKLTAIRQRLAQANAVAATARQWGADAWHAFKQRHPILARAVPTLGAGQSVAVQLKPVADLNLVWAVHLCNNPLAF